MLKTKLGKYQLNIPLIRQKPGSVDCGLACLIMVFKYFGVTKTFEEIKKDLKVYKFGTYSPQLGLYLIKNGFKVEMITQHPGLFAIFHRQSSQEDILHHIKILQKNNTKKQYKNSFRYLVDFMEAGGKITVKVPSVDDIRDSLKNKHPLIALLTTRFLADKDPKFNFHFNVVTGIFQKYIFVNDPSSSVRGGKKKYAINDFLFGVYASTFADLDNGSLLVVKK